MHGAISEILASTRCVVNSNGVDCMIFNQLYGFCMVDITWKYITIHKTWFCETFKILRIHNDWLRIDN